MIISYKSHRFITSTMICAVILYPIVIPPRYSEFCDAKKPSRKKRMKLMSKFYQSYTTPMFVESGDTTPIYYDGWHGPPVVVPHENSTNHTATIIFLHDWGESGDVWWYEMNQIKHPYFKVVLPHAGYRHFSLLGNTKPRTLSWYDHDSRFYPQTGKNITQLINATLETHKLIDDEIKSGILPERIIVGGYSQGAALALHAVMSYPQRLGALVLLSPWMPEQKLLNETFNPVNKDIEVFQGELASDCHTPREAARNITLFLEKEISKNLELKQYIGYHLTTEKKFNDMRNFCLKHVGPIGDCNMTHVKTEWYNW